MVSSLGSLIFAALGFGVHVILEKKVPEFLEFLESVILGISSSSRGARGEYGQNSTDEFKLSRMEEGAGVGSSADDYGGAPEMTPTLKDGKFGDHIIVNNIAIKNEPKLMAEAIRTIMSQDDDGAPAPNPHLNPPKK